MQPPKKKPKKKTHEKKHQAAEGEELYCSKQWGVKDMACIGEDLDRIAADLQHGRFVDPSELLRLIDQLGTLLSCRWDAALCGVGV